MKKKPNILFILTDQWHPRWIGYANHVVRTPHLDAFAREGMNFERMYTPDPLCMPARASIFTGLTPRGHGVRMNGIPLPQSVPTFVDALRRGGYCTHGVGKMHLGVTAGLKGTPVEQLDPAEYLECAALWRSGKITKTPTPFYGFESFEYGTGHGFRIVGEYMHWLEREHPDSAKMVNEPRMTEPPSPAFKLFNRETFKWALPAEHHPTTWTIDRSIAFLENQKESEQPFFLFCSMNDPHSPFAAPVPYCDKYDPKDMPAPLEKAGELDTLPPHFRAMVEQGILTSGNAPEPMRATRAYYAECAAQYCGMIELIDDQIGRLLTALKSNGLEEDTLVVFTSDHGEAMGDHGLWGKGPYHIDGVIRVPFLARWPGHIPPNSKVSAPCSLLDLAPTFLSYAGIDASNARPIDPPESAAAPSALPGMDLSELLEGKKTLEDRAVLVEMDEDYLGLRMRTLVTKRHRMTLYSGHDYGELFDLEKDPSEFDNLWNDPSARPLRERLRTQLLEEIIRTDNTLPRQICRA